MSVLTAFQFIQHLRADEKLVHQLLALHGSPDVDDLVELGAQLGLVFTAEELNAAHQHEWSMRWVLSQAQAAAKTQLDTSSTIALHS